MTEKPNLYQPGAILHEAIIGAFRASGYNFNDWCIRNGVTPSVARNATFGQSRGPNGKALLKRLIDAAGRDFVDGAYARRLSEHAAQFKGAAER
ncbi:hypothetical protein [Antarcticimicrobium sediminis]|uniref:Uncharacterized protein n=1 Tax=Antarcticimicrobium sediminis TaxID=2546227 RepID=A0A4R5F0N9_9RHOB|nr:hypothetical protein [Antarcticimicrobium sediminis]TDE40961.1 hypothetical protein E1B25_01745 [Antarcticimicrobium sediminis]